MASSSSKPYILGLDLDNTVGDYIGAIRQFVSEKRGIPLEDIPESPANYNLQGCGWPFESYEDYLSVHRDAARNGLFLRVNPYPGVQEALHKLSKAGVWIRVVTHRLLITGDYGLTVRDTVRWLDNNDIRFHGLCFEQLKDSIGADVYLEDSPSNIETLRDSGVHVIIRDHLYNRHVDGPRFTSWGDDIVDMILDHKKELGR